MRASLSTAGERVAIDCPLRWVSSLLEGAADGQLRPAAARDADLLVTVDEDQDPYDVSQGQPWGRGAWRTPAGLVVHDVVTSGFDLLLRLEGTRPHFAYRWRPPLRDRLAALLAPARHRLLVRQALLDYPALWAASCRGRAPLHAAAVATERGAVLLAGPSGVGKSTIVREELRRGGSAASDNLVVSDGTSVWGLVEPVRAPGGPGRRTSHGRREQHLQGRTALLTPSLLAAVTRRTTPGTSVHAIGAEAVVGSLVSGTYMAGELRRFWGFAALLSSGIGRGPSHPDVAGISARLAAAVPAVAVVVGHHTPPRVSDLFRPELMACP